MVFFAIVFGNGVTLATLNETVATGMLVCYFWAALYKPERIRSPLGFRLAGLFLALGLLTPVLVNLIRTSGIFGTPPESPTDEDLVSRLLQLFPMGILSIIVVLGLDSVMPPGEKRE